MDEFAVADVYDYAAQIGQDIEKIVTEYGKEVIEDIMPKIVFVLEQLESYVSKNKADQVAIEQLRVEKDRLLIHTKRDEAIQRQLEDKIEYLESVIDTDKKKLQETIFDLQRENEELREDVGILQHDSLQQKATAHPGDVEIMLRMKATIDSQRDQIRQMASEIRSQKEEIDALQEQSDRLSNINERLRSNLDKLSSELLTLERKTWQRTDNEDGGLNPESLAAETSAADKSEVRLEDFDSVLVQLNDSRADKSLDFDKTFDSVCTQTEDEAYSSAGECSSPQKKDPNRPRYTLVEMQKVLEERMMFKIKMQALEEELELFKDMQREKKEKQIVEEKPSGVRTFMQKFLGK